MAAAAAVSRRQDSIPPPGAGWPLCDRLRLVRGKLAIEVDGGQHNETAAVTRDAKRTQWLESQGFQVLRFWNNDVLRNGAGCQELIALAIERRRSLSFME